MLRGDKIMNGEEGLRNLTERYWFEKWGVEKYIQKLLPEELNYLKEHEGITTKPTEILVQLVGFSWEPLLISVCAYRPEKVILILNEWYNRQEGKARGVKFQEIIAKLKEQNLIDNTPEIFPHPWETVKDRPEDVFKFLKKHVLPFVNEGTRVVVDITGAKKSMGSGAYLFSSYTNASVTYIDYGEYNEEYGKPYGYTCKPDELENPMELFKLREWDRVRQRYEHYAFWAAKELIEEIKKAAGGFFEPEELKSIEPFMKCMEFYGLWDDGDYKRAWDELQYQRKGITCPTAVEKLGKIWPDKNDLKKGVRSIEGLEDTEDSIYLKDTEIFVYAYDELEKIKRLIKHGEDYRSALLRAAGLNDFLLKARVIKLWVNNQFVIEEKDTISESKNREDMKQNSDLLKELDKRLLEFAGASHLIKSLRWKPSKPDYCIRIQGLEGLGEIKLHRLESAPLLNEFWKKVEFTKMSLPDDVFNLRNKAIHFCLSIPKEMAEVAVKMAEKNLEDFQSEWVNVTLTNGIYKAMSWNNLCVVCDIKFLPRQAKEEQK